VTAELLDAAPGLEVVGRLGVGLDNIDLAACEARGVAVRPATGANAAAVAEYVVGALLLLVRGVFDAGPRMTAGEWPRADLVGRELGGRRLGLVGFGTIAREVADRARALGMQIAAHDPFLPDDSGAWQQAERMALPELLARCDAISLHVPLTDGTRHLVDARAIEAMPEGAVLVNTSRGGVVDEAAVVSALRSGHLGGAALDVFEDEPLTGEAASRFAGVPNLVLTPHVAGVTIESNRRVSAMTAFQVREALR
jgi:(S)-sulfolactate dehydrogenase